VEDLAKTPQSDAEHSRRLRSEGSLATSRDRLSIYLSYLCVGLYFVEEGIIGSDHSLEGPPLFLWFERAIAVFYSYELVFRFKEANWSVHHLRSVHFWIDLVAVCPFYVGFFVPPGQLHLVRTLRLLRLLKVLPFMPGVRLLTRAVVRSWPQVRTLIAVEGIIVLFSTAAIYECEREVEGTAFSNLFDSIWFTAVTVTTVGYGDMTPQTILGRSIALLTFMTGLVLFAVFAGVIGSAITDILDDEIEVEEPRN